MALLDRDLIASDPTIASGPPLEVDAPLPWSDVHAVHGEWPQEYLSAPEDLISWGEGLARYQREDYPSMIEAADLMSPALAHHLYGPGVLSPSDLRRTVHHVLFAATSTPPDRETFVVTARRAVRLALTVARQQGWQPRHLGGDDTLTDLFDDRPTYARLGKAIAPDGDYAGDLEAFFVASIPLG